MQVKFFFANVASGVIHNTGFSGMKLCRNKNDAYKDGHYNKNINIHYELSKKRDDKEQRRKRIAREACDTQTPAVEE